MEYVDPGASFYETRYRAPVMGNLHRRAKGIRIRSPAHEPGTVSQEFVPYGL
jgi:hypothetical protein